MASVVSFSLKALLQPGLKDEGVVVPGIARGIQEGYQGMRPESGDKLGGGGVGIEFGEVAAFKLSPFGRGVLVQPLTQLGAGSHILGPEVVMKTLVRLTLRPEPVDEHAETVVAFWVGIYAGDIYCGRHGVEGLLCNIWRREVVHRKKLYLCYMKKLMKKDEPMRQVVDFLNGLRDNNNREWFMAHREDYLQAKATFEAFAQELISAIGEYDPTVRGLTVPQCTYRIYKDMRFTHDGLPYKTHMGVYICRGGKKSGYSGYYFHVAAEATNTFGFGGHCLAAGDYQCLPAVLKTLREDITDGSGEFERLLQGAPGFHLDPGMALKRVPRGFDPESRWAELLKYKVYCLIQAVPTQWVTAPDLAKRVAEAFRPTQPFLDYINRAIDYVRGEEG